MVPTSWGYAYVVTWAQGAVVPAYPTASDTLDGEHQYANGLHNNSVQCSPGRLPILWRLPQEGLEEVGQTTMHLADNIGRWRGQS